MPKFRYHTRTTAGPWRDSREQAEQDALAAGVAHRDDYPGAPLTWEIWAGVEEGEGDGEPGMD